MLSTAKWINISLRAVMEAGIIAALAFWGFHTGGNTAAKVLLGIGAPLIGFGFWGAVDFRRAGSKSEFLRLLQELVVSGIAAAAFYAAGRPILGIALALLSVIHHSLVYFLGERLIKR